MQKTGAPFFAQYHRKRMISMKISIKLKFFAAICAVAVAFTGILTVLNLFFYDDYYLMQRQKSLTKFYNEFNHSYAGDLNSIADLLDHSENTDGVRLSIVSSDGTVIYDTVMREQLADSNALFSSSGRNDLFYGLSLTQAALRGVDGQTLNDRGSVFVNVQDTSRQEEYLCLVGRLNQGTEYLIARVPFAYMEENSAFNSIFLMITACLTLVICIFLSFLASQHFTKPLIRISEVANAISELDFSKKYEGRSGDEIGQLGESINRLSEHLKEAIGELQQSNEQLAREVKEKERVDQMRQEFIVNVSHELKTPIALIQGYAEGLREGIADNPEDRAYYCETIESEAVRMNHLVMQLLNLSKLELGRETPAPAEIELDELLGSVVEKTAVLRADRNLTLTCAPCALSVYTDYGMLEQVVTNYLTNAIRYTPEGGQITVYAAREPDGATTVSVFNEGEGLPENELQMIWEKFYRTDKARSRESGGTGVGLSIVRATAEVLGATCGAENTEMDGKKGIVFWFRLPAALPPSDLPLQ